MSWFAKNIEVPVRFELEVIPHNLPGGVPDFARARAALTRIKDQLGSLKKGYVKGISFAGIGESVAKDLAKTLVNGYLDGLERRAWVDYFQKQTEADAYYPLYHTAAGQWGEALDDQDALLARKADLLQGLGEVGGLKRLSSKDFPPGARLVVTLTLQGPEDPADPIQVIIGGAQATRVGRTNAYSLLASAAKHGADGSLSVVLR